MKGNKKSTFKKIGKPETWEYGKKVSIATMLERKDGKRGISIKTGSKVDYMSKPRYGQTVWIDEELNLPFWLGWFIKTIKKLYYNLFRKKIPIEIEAEVYKSKIEILTKQLTESQKKLEELELKQEENKRLLELAKKVQINSNDLSKALVKFIGVIEESLREKKGKEEEIKNEIKLNRWLLGLECFIEAKNQNIDIQAQIDLHIKTKYNQDVIFEIKSPNLKPFIRKSNYKKRRLTLSLDLAEGLSELIIYLRKTDLYSDKKSEGTYGIQKALGYILVGYKLEDEQLYLLKEFNFHLYPHIQIITYDDLIKNIRRELSIIKNIEEYENK